MKINESRLKLFGNRGEIGAVAKLGFPVVINHASLAAMQFTDAWMAGKLGSTELAAMTPAGLLVSLLSIFGIEALTGVTSQVSQAIGKGRSTVAAAATWQGVYCGALFGWLCLILYPSAYDVFNVLIRNQSHELLTLETQYFRISLLGLAPLMAATAWANFFTGIGRTRTVMMASLLGVACNALFSYLLAFGFGPLRPMGFDGLAWGTLTATIVQGGILLLCFIGPATMRLTYRTQFARFSKKRAWRLVRTGFPSGVHGSVDYLAWGVVLTWLISFFGEAHLGAQTIMVRCITLSFLPADGMASALTTLVGQAVGARDYLQARRYARAGFFLIALWMGTMALIYIFFGNWIVRLFTSDPAVIAAGSTAILWVAAFQFFDAMNVTYTNALQGAGDTAWPGVVNLTLSLVILFGGGLAVVTFLPGTASSGVWAVATFYIFCQGMLFYRRWRTREWQNPALLA